MARLTETQLAARILGSKYRATSTQAERSASASRAAKARWAQWRAARAAKVSTKVDTDDKDKA